MTRTVLQPSDEELAARLLAELNAMPPSIDVEATVTGCLLYTSPSPRD